MFKTSVTALILGLVAVTQSGCLLVAAAAATGGTVAYVKGDLETTLDSTPDKIGPASEAALKEMKLAIVSSRSTNLDADVLARTADDAKVHVVVKAQGEKTSHISIRVGVFGDQAMSNRILMKINEKLKEPAVATTPTPPVMED
jgi:hypothetical protein